MQIARLDMLTPLLLRSLAALPKAVSAFQEAAPETRAAAPLAQSQANAVGQGIQNVAMLITLAAADPSVERRRKVAADSDRGLKGLEGLHVELLRGAPSPDRLRELAEWTATATPPDDPALASIFRDIEVRVKVELAKFDIEA